MDDSSHGREIDIKKVTKYFEVAHSITSHFVAIAIFLQCPLNAPKANSGV